VTRAPCPRLELTFNHRRRLLVWQKYYPLLSSCATYAATKHPQWFRITSVRALIAELQAMLDALPNPGKMTAVRAAEALCVKAAFFDEHGNVRGRPSTSKMNQIQNRLCMEWFARRSGRRAMPEHAEAAAIAAEFRRTLGKKEDKDDQAEVKRIRAIYRARIEEACRGLGGQA
jgi:hypothetical protein